METAKSSVKLLLGENTTHNSSVKLDNHNDRSNGDFTENDQDGGSQKEAKLNTKVQSADKSSR